MAYISGKGKVVEDFSWLSAAVKAHFYAGSAAIYVSIWVLITGKEILAIGIGVVGLGLLGLVIADRLVIIGGQVIRLLQTTNQVIGSEKEYYTDGEFAEFRGAVRKILELG